MEMAQLVTHCFHYWAVKHLKTFIKFPSKGIFLFLQICRQPVLCKEVYVSAVELLNYVLFVFL